MLLSKQRVLGIRKINTDSIYYVGLQNLFGCPRRGHGAEFTVIILLAARLARGLRQLYLRPRQLQAAQRRGQCYQR